MVTGKGPQKDHYLEIFNQRNTQVWEGLINITTVWLTADDYPKLVQSADLGVCLHYSSSGFDLPRKVVDMFSAGLPCLAKNYLCIEELVQDGRNGRLFETSDDLCDQLFDALKAGPDGEILKRYRENLREFGRDDSWDDQWKEVILG